MSYIVNNINLDNIFKPRIASKISNIEFLSGSQDISNKYEKTLKPADQINFNTGFLALSNGIYTDLRYIFQSINYYEIIINSTGSTPETKAKYENYNNGTITISINTSYLKAVNGYYNFTFSGAGSTTVSIAAPNTNNTYVHTFNGLKGPADYVITVRDNNSNLSKSVRVYVGYS